VLDLAVRWLQDDDALLRQIDALVSKIDESERELASGDDPAESVSVHLLYGQLAVARRRYETLHAARDERAGETGPLLDSRPANAAGIRESLRPDEALLEYLVTADRIRLFVVTRDSIRLMVTLQTEANLINRVRLARDLVGHAPVAGTPSPVVLDALFEELLRPALRSGGLRGVRRLVVVPHGVLTYLPFAALRDDSTGRYLVEDYALVVLPSAGVLPALRQRNAFAGPLPRAAIFAPLPAELPATRAEAAAVSAALDHAVTQVGTAATELRFRQALAAGSIVHVASHAELDPSNPLFSAIAFAPRSDAFDDDGRFELHELLGMAVSSPLVFLSGCETGLGPAGSTSFARGEDYATLAQAVLYAGARNVVATLWRVEDDGAGAFATRFYEHLRFGDPVMALAHAQRDLLHSRYSAPFYWAPYMIAGDGGSLTGAQTPHAVSVR
jgi:CHAT domain-containing protein